MLLFYCIDCKRIIFADDSESTDQIVDRLEEHLTQCPTAAFTYEGTSGIARRKLGNLRSFLEAEHLVERIQLRSLAPDVGKLSDPIQLAGGLVSKGTFRRQRTRSYQGRKLN